MTKKINYILGILLMFSSMAFAEETIRLKPNKKEDMTLTFREALAKVKDKKVTVILEKGTYYFRPEYAYEKYCYITNHENGAKRIAFPFEGFESVMIEGNGSKIILHGRMLPFLFEDCNKIQVNNLTVDWDIPFSFQGKVVAVNKKEGWRDLKPYTDGFSWKLKKGRITFPNVDNFKFSSLGSSLPFDEETKDISHRAFDMSSRPTYVEKLANGNLRFHERLKVYPKVGDIFHSKGPKGENRYAPAFHVISSKNIVFDNVTVHHALGMGFLAEKSEHVKIINCGIYVEKGSDRVVTTIADATHFCNVKGDVLIENCRFEGMLDDGTNVHGTYVKVDKVLDEYTVRVALAHFQQTGFEFAGVGDEIWFIHAPSPKRKEVNKVKSVKPVNANYINLTFEEKLPSTVRGGSLLENKTWNPTFTMRGCTIQKHRARNIVLKTPKKIVIEDNYFSSMMSAILFRGESYYWFESGVVEDVLIQNNTFENCATAGREHAIMWVTPRLAKEFDVTETYDRNIRFINNKISTFDNRIVWADRTEGLVIKGNTITQTFDKEQNYPNAHMFDFTNCKDILISGNTYKGNNKLILNADKVSRKTLKTKKNKGINFDILP